MGVELADLARMAADNLNAETWQAESGRVEARNGGFVDVQPMTKRAVDNREGGTSYETLPIIPNVPIAFPKAGAISITWEVPVGSFGVILHLTSSEAEFRRDGTSIATPGDLRRKHLGHAVFLPLFPGPDSAVADSVDDPALVLTAPAVKIGSKDATHFAALANLVEARLTEFAGAFCAAVPTPMDGGAAIQAYVKGQLGGAGWDILTGAPPTVASSKVKIDD